MKMLKITLIMIIILVCSVSGTCSSIVSSPEVIDFQNVYQGRQYNMSFVLFLQEEEQKNLDYADIERIRTSNRALSVNALKDPIIDSPGRLNYEIIFSPANILGNFQEKIIVEYAGTKRLEIPVKANISQFFVISPPSIVIRDLAVQDQTTRSVFIESKGKVPFNIIEAYSDQGSVSVTSIDYISSHRKKINMHFSYSNKGRHFGKLTIKTDNKEFSHIEIDILANIKGFIYSDKKDLAFGRIDKEIETYQKSIQINTKEGYYLEITGIEDDSRGLLKFLTNRVADHYIIVTVLLDSLKAKNDFFGYIFINARAGEHAEELAVTYHGRTR